MLVGLIGQASHHVTVGSIALACVFALAFEAAMLRARGTPLQSFGRDLSAPVTAPADFKICPNLAGKPICCNNQTLSERRAAAVVRKTPRTPI